MMGLISALTRASPDEAPRIDELESELAAETCTLCEAAIAEEGTGGGTDGKVTKLAASLEVTAEASETVEEDYSILGDMVLPAAFGSSGLVAFCSMVAGADKVL